jgi:hypothetical protein
MSPSTLYQLLLRGKGGNGETNFRLFLYLFGEVIKGRRRETMRGHSDPLSSTHSFFAK